MTRRLVVAIDTLVVDGVDFERKAFEASLRHELGARLAGRRSPEAEPRRVRDSDGVGSSVAAAVHRELSR